VAQGAATTEGRETTTHHARVVWKGGKEDLRAHEITLAEQTLAASSAEHLGGDASKADPEELFVSALSSCHMLWFLSLARARRLRVTAYEDEPEGTMDGTRFTRVALRPRIEFEQDVDAAALGELHHEAHERCFIANSVNCPVEVENAP
jgi:organic hydroperoxide reductase OsmC/OhrA